MLLLIAGEWIKGFYRQTLQPTNSLIFKKIFWEDFLVTLHITIQVFLIWGIFSSNACLQKVHGCMIESVVRSAVSQLFQEGKWTKLSFRLRFFSGEHGSKRKTIYLPSQMNWECLFKSPISSGKTCWIFVWDERVRFLSAAKLQQLKLKMHMNPTKDTSPVVSFSHKGECLIKSRKSRVCLGGVWFLAYKGSHIYTSLSYSATEKYSALMGYLSRCVPC